AGLIASGSTIEGRAAAVSGVRLKVAGKDVQLSGIEAPEPGQTCGQRSCAAQAKAALQKLVQGKRATCAITGTVSNGGDGEVPSATCTIDGADIAAQLVRGGNVFATSGLFASYASQEREARNGKLGLWRAGADRPAEYRTKVFDEARKSAPDGCPIKGVINGSSKTYVAPWSVGYDKAKVRTSRGERWFCSEEDAREAGWKAAEGS
ncbi:MAG: thermonuclease family protein, partial [Verrucomicrobiae bacterium]|nr:thermonuclease family protein [Verrucomicrobiae bacterium]